MRRREQALWRRAAAWGAQRGPAWFARSAPIFIGVLFALFSPGARRTVRANLRRIRGRRGFLKETQDTAATFVHFAQSLTAALAPQRPLFRDRPVLVEGKEQVDPYFDAGQGVLFVTAHVGPWDVAAMKLRTMVEAPVLMLMSGEVDEEASAFQDALRLGEKVRVLRVGDTPLDALPLVEHLDQGGLVVAQMDRVPHGTEAITVELFGAPFSLPCGLFRLAAALGCPVAPVLSARDTNGEDRVVVAQPFHVPRRPSEEELQGSAQQAANCLEEHLCRYPTQWFHFAEDRSGL